jgi:hypothetical protein
MTFVKNRTRLLLVKWVSHYGLFQTTTLELFHDGRLADKRPAAGRLFEETAHKLRPW